MQKSLSQLLHTSENPIVAIIQRSLHKMQLPQQYSMTLSSDSHLLSLTDQALTSDNQLLTFL